MAESLQIHDGSKFGSFDGEVLEVSGLSGSTKGARLTVEAIESIMLAEAGDELMLGVKSRRGGFGMVVSKARRAEWQALVQAVNDARARVGR
jgi:hypothetical protein